MPRMGNIKLLVPVKGFTGMTMFHCHIREQKEMDMMGLEHRITLPVRRTIMLIVRQTSKVFYGLRFSGRVLCSCNSPLFNT